jgi:MFS family permease
VLTAGTAAYAVGKFVTGPVIDSMGGRKVPLWTATAATAACVRRAHDSFSVLPLTQVFLLAMLCSILLTVVFTFGSAVWYFTLVWIGNRLVQAAGTRGSLCTTITTLGDSFSLLSCASWSLFRAGWPAVVKITSSWYHPSESGKAMGFISLSFLFGGTPQLC